MGEEKKPRALVIRSAHQVGDPDPYLYASIQQVHGHLYFDMTLGGGLNAGSKTEIDKVAGVLEQLLERVLLVSENYDQAKRVNLYDEGKKDEGGEAPKA